MAPRHSVDPALSPSEYPFSPRSLLTSRNCFSFSFPLPGTLRRTAFSVPLGDSRLSSLWVSAHQPPTISTPRDPVWGAGWDSLILYLRAGASGPRVNNGGSIVEDEVLTAELDVLSPCQVPL